MAVGMALAGHVIADETSPRLHGQKGGAAGGGWNSPALLRQAGAVRCKAQRDDAPGEAAPCPALPLSRPPWGVVTGPLRIWGRHCAGD